MYTLTSNQRYIEFTYTSVTNEESATNQSKAYMNE